MNITRETLEEIKKQIKNYSKKLLKYLKEKDPAEAEKFKKGSQAGVSKIIQNFDNLQFFHGEEDYGLGGMLVIAEYRGETPYMLFFKHGLFDEEMVGAFVLRMGPHQKALFN